MVNFELDILDGLGKISMVIPSVSEAIRLNRLMKECVKLIDDLADAKERIRSLEAAAKESALAAELAKEGYLQRVELNIPEHPPLTIRGYALTLPGAYTYCSSELCSGAGGDKEDL
ncbi:MAG: hypothetical protein ACYC4K_10865 [Thiobacillus sp.]